MPELVLPTTGLHAALLRCRGDWGPGLHEDGFGIGPDDDLDSPAGFAAWVRDRRRLAHPAGAACPPERHGSPRWIVEDGEVLGGILLRHHLDDDLGQVGYGVRPSARGRGLASWALGQVLAEAGPILRVDRLLVVCLDDNEASARTVERCGGVLEGVRATGHGAVRRYWVPLDRRPARHRAGIEKHGGRQAP